MLAVHQFGHNGLAGLAAGMGQQFQALGTQPLEAVGAGARLECAAAQDAGPAACTRCATKVICSLLSTLQGPAITAK